MTFLSRKELVEFQAIAITGSFRQEEKFPRRNDYFVYLAAYCKLSLLNFFKTNSYKIIGQNNYFAISFSHLLLNYKIYLNNFFFNFIYSLKTNFIGGFNC